MAKKDLGKVTANLASLADRQPTQRPAPVKGEETIQFSLSLRKKLRQELAQLAMNEDMTMRAFVLSALKDRGLSVTDEDLLDMRKKKG